jgi:hypothetical protein
MITCRPNLEEKYGTKWRRSENIRKRFSRRQQIIKRVKSAATRLGIAEHQAARKLEVWRTRKNWPLHKLNGILWSNPDLWGPNDQELAAIE